MIRSYSRPSWPRTFAMAERILRALSSRLKSKNGSVTNGPVCKSTRGRGGASRVAIGIILSGLEDSVVGRAHHILHLWLGLGRVRDPSLHGPWTGQRPVSTRGTPSPLLGFK